MDGHVHSASVDKLMQFFLSTVHPMPETQHESKQKIIMPEIMEEANSSRVFMAVPTSSQ